jgi:hypothetical protein
MKLWHGEPQFRDVLSAFKSDADARSGTRISCVPEAIECAMQISELVSRKLPMAILRGPPESLVLRLNCRDHEVADARQISVGLRRGHRFRPCGHAARGRKTDRQDGGCGSGDRGNPDRAAPGACGFRAAYARTGRLASSLSSVIG